MDTGKKEAAPQQAAAMLQFQPNYTTNIAEIQLENFQCHANAVLRPGGGGQLCVITGPSDSGKTAILRALRWLYYNVPNGTDFIRVGASFARVRVTLESGVTVIRERSKSYNRYILVEPGKERQLFEGFGNNVPQEIQAALGAWTFVFGDLELAPNLSEQLDGPFLGKAVSGGARAKVLGKLAGTEEVDLAARELNTDLYHHAQDEKRLAKEIETLNEQLREFDYLERVGANLAQAETLLRQVGAAAQRRESLKRLYDAQAENARLRRQAEAVKARLALALPLIETELKAAEMHLLRYQRITVLDARLKNNQAQADAIRRVACATAGGKEAAALAAVTAVMVQRRERLRTLRATLAQIAAQDHANRTILKRTENAAQAAALAAGVADTAQKAELLKGLYSRWTETWDRLTWFQAAAQRTAQAEEAETVATRTLEQVQRLKNLLALLERKKTAEGAQIALATRLADLNAEVRQATAAYAQTLEAAGRCPVCGSPIHKEHIEEVI